MPELLTLIRELLIGHGDARDIGIRFLVFLLGTLTAALVHYVRRDIKYYGESLEKFGKNLNHLDHNVSQMEEIFAKYKREIAEIMLKNSQIMQTEAHSLRKSMVELDLRLSQTQLHLEQSHETREDIYGFMKKIHDVESETKNNYGRIIFLESFNSKYEGVLKGLQRLMESRLKKKP